MSGVDVVVGGDLHRGLPPHPADCGELPAGSDGHPPVLVGAAPGIPPLVGDVGVVATPFPRVGGLTGVEDRLDRRSLADSGAPQDVAAGRKHAVTSSGP